MQSNGTHIPSMSLLPIYMNYLLNKFYLYDHFGLPIYAQVSKGSLNNLIRLN